MSITTLLGSIARVIINPLIVLGFLVAMLYFFWGIFTFIAHASDESGREEGKRSIMWGLIGIFIMVGVFSIINIILHTFGIDQSQGVNSGYVQTLLK